MNVEDWAAAPLHEVVARITVEAEARGAEVAGTELVGLMPAGAAVAAAGAQLGIAGSASPRCSSCGSSTSTRLARDGASHGDLADRRRSPDRRRVGRGGGTASRPGSPVRRASR